MVRNCGVRSLILALVGLAVPVGGVAQTASDVRLANLFSGLGPADPIRVVTPSFFVEDAFVASVGDRSVGLRQDGSDVDVPFPDIRGVSVRDNHWLQGTLWGAGAGMLVGGISGLMYASFTCTTPETCTTDERKGLIRGGILLGVAGGIGGFMIGRHSVYWRPIFP